MTHLRNLLFASSNHHKVDEIRLILPPDYLVQSLSDIHWSIDIPEPFDTFEDNARAKADFVFQHTGLPCFADDSGLEIDALEGRPGVHSAMYAGEQRSSTDNVNKVLEELKDQTNRAARFIAVIAYRPNENEHHLFKGIVEGNISLQPLGQDGFGYDPIFIPHGFEQTFGQLAPTIKNLTSHRAKAMQMFIDFLKVNFPHH